MKKLLFLSVFAAFSAAPNLALAQQVENVTPVIGDRLIRSGSTNQMALDDSALKALCNSGYRLAIYLYAGAKPHTVRCEHGSIAYLSMTNYEHPSSILDRVGAAMKGGGNVLIHCNWGVHASNFVSALALSRFCGFSGQQASDYFLAGVPKGSLAPSRVKTLAAEIVASAQPGSVMNGCPTPL